jgi:hypothetical protein
MLLIDTVVSQTTTQEAGYQIRVAETQAATTVQDRSHPITVPAAAVQTGLVIRHPDPALHVAQDRDHLPVAGVAHQEEDVTR